MSKYKKSEETESLKEDSQEDDVMTKEEQEELEKKI